MNSTELFKAFVDQEFGGSRVAAARALGMNKSMAIRLYNGDRNVSPAVALRIEKLSKRRFRKEAFIWPETTEAA